MGCYRRDQASDPDTYIAAITLVLTDFPHSVVEWATDPRSGIQGDERYKAFPPNSGEVISFCAAEMERIAKRERGALKPKPKQSYTPPINTTTPGRRANIFIAADQSLYPTLVAWAQGKDANSADWKFAPMTKKNRDGIMISEVAGMWVSLNVLQNLHAIRKTAAPQIASMDSMRDSLMRMAGQIRAREIDAP